MKLHQTLLITAVSCLLPIVASATSYTINATDNIFGAGLSTPPSPGGGGGGTLPVEINVNSGAFQFQYVSGHATPDDLNSSYNNLDANGIVGTGTDVSNPGGSLSAFLANNAFALVGVYLGPGAPSGPAPSTLDFTSSGLGTNFTDLAPQIGQIFFIGNGTNSSNLTQTFFAPTGATELYLGFADSYNFTSEVGQYSDNAGSININVIPVPEPAPAALVLAGSALMALMRFRNKR